MSLEVHSEQLPLSQAVNVPGVSPGPDSRFKSDPEAPKSLAVGGQAEVQATVCEGL